MTAVLAPTSCPLRPRIMTIRQCIIGEPSPIAFFLTYNVSKRCRVSLDSSDRVAV
jgi:hypothetical protein